MGGEPLTNRRVLRMATERAARLARERGVDIGFSVTSNGTPITPEDGAFFEQFGFAVTISLDGPGDTHDRLRPFSGGGGSYRRIIGRVLPLLRMQRRMIACGREFERRVVAGERYPFSNMAAAMHEIHKGTHRPYPCGAGAGYLGVSAEGGLYACHRFANEAAAGMGDVRSGVDPERQNRWLDERHVHRQEPCRSCWARYLCGGGCHHEVIHRGRPACDCIRGWLD
jgi:uncharacterized protein